MRCLALFTGGLDAQIAVRMMQRQGLEVVGLFVQTPFTVVPEAARAAAERLQIELFVDPWIEDYLAIVRRPRFGYTEALAPCLDCRIGMLQRARAMMEPAGASFLVSGEVIGQRPSSLRSRDLETMAVHGGVEDLLLRPLSAKLLPPTLPERHGWVDRELLHGWHGRGRREQLRLAREWNLIEAPGHAAGCLLLQEVFARRLKQLLALVADPPPWQVKTLTVGRHFTINEAVHLVVAKNALEGETLLKVFRTAARSSAIYLEPANFRGPSGLAIGPVDEPALRSAAAVMVSLGKDVPASGAQLRLVGCSWAESLHLEATDPTGIVQAWH